ncbi:helix-turn-helix domain-containing protein [Phascolarctobacterium succinatutens]|uniref:helix-turn-helix domain-containing protein n=1 Tax=Phascolarctobacterium succinatutens TaxID=626940 RepID=UPI003AF0E421
MSEKELTDLIERIKERRLKLEMSYQDLSNATGISKSTLQRYETGYIKKVPINQIEILAKALHTTPSYLMGWDNTVTESPSVTLTPPTKKVPKDLKKILEDEEVTLNGRMMSAEDKEKMMRIIEAAFYEAKEMNKRK